MNQQSHYHSEMCCLVYVDQLIMLLVLRRSMSYAVCFKPLNGLCLVHSFQRILLYDVYNPVDCAENIQQTFALLLMYITQWAVVYF